MFLKVKDLKKYYNSKEQLIRNLNFSVDKGDIVSFVGESGSGKTTFLKCLAGLEKINSGLIELNGNVLNYKNTFVSADKRKIGFVFQDYPLFPHLNILENISINLEKKFLSKIDYILNLTNLKNLCNRYPHQLSGGEQQRACLARALVREPDLLLLDEPFSNLDALLKNSLRRELSEMIKPLGISILFITHDLDDALAIADEVVIMKDGELLESGSITMVSQHAKNEYVKSIFSNLKSSAEIIIHKLSR